MLFSVLIPAHNEEKDIVDCLKALDGKGYEIIVVNDGSTDGTEQVARKFGATVLNFDKGHSASFARNRGAEIAKGEYLIFIDADIIPPRDFVKRVESFLPFDCLSYRLASHNPRTIFERSWSAYRKKMERPGAEGCFHCVKKEIFEKVGGFDENIFYFEDFDFKEKVMRLNPVYKVSDITVEHKEVQTFGDFRRQRKWHGKGIATMLLRKRKFHGLKYFLPCFFPSVIPIILFPYWLYYYKYTHEPTESFIWVTTDLTGRYISLYYFLKFLVFRK